MNSKCSLVSAYFGLEWSCALFRRLIGCLLGTVIGMCCRSEKSGLLPLSSRSDRVCNSLKVTNQRYEYNNSSEICMDFVWLSFLRNAYCLRIDTLKISSYTF